MSSSTRLRHAVLSSCIAHLDTSLYLFLRPVLIEELKRQGIAQPALEWSMGLFAAGILRIIVALAWGRVRQRFGDAWLLRTSLLGIGGSACAMAGVGWLLQTSYLDGRWAATAWVVLRGVQGALALAQSSAARAVIMDHAPKRLGSFLSAFSTMAGVVGAAAICWLLRFVSPTLEGWPWIYLGAGVAIGIGLPSPMASLPDTNQIPRQITLWNLHPLLPCLTAGAFGYATFYWVNSSPLKLLVSEDPFYQQTLLMGLDCGLLLILQPLLKRISTLMVLLISAWACCYALGGYCLGCLSEPWVTLIILLAGVGASSRYSAWLKELTHPLPLFPYSVLASAVGSAMGGLILHLSYHAMALGQITLAPLPFLVVFGLQAVMVLFIHWRGHHPSMSSEGNKEG